MRSGRAPACRVTCLLVAAALGLACGGERHEEPAAPEIGVGFELIENSHGGEVRFQAALTLTNRGGAPLAASGWELYFNFGRSADPDSLPGEVTLTDVNGDLRRLTPTADFAPLAPGDSRRILFTGPGWVIKESEAPAGFYFVFAGDEERPARVEAARAVTIAPFRSRRQTDRTAGDRVPVPTPASTHAENLAVSLLPADRVGPIVPTPLRLETGPGRVSLEKTWRIHHAAGLEREAAFLARLLGLRLGSEPEIRVGAAAAADAVTLRLAAPAEGGPREPAGGEAYRLRITSGHGIEITGSGPAGVFYAIQSLRALMPAADGPAPEVELPEVEIEDAPRFGYRGIHLDVARNFQSRQTVEKLLEVAAFYKLNRFHFHLTDDEGWRLAVAALPELTQVGGRRGHTSDERDRLVPSFGSGPDPEASHGSGHYSRDDFVAILRHARDRHIRVIPEFDVPGHARAAVKAMAARHARLLEEGRPEEAAAFLLQDPDDRSTYRSVQGWADNVVDACLPSTYRFLETVVDEVVALYAEAGADLDAIHVGGDEVPAGVWEGSPACERLLRDDPGLDDVAELPEHFLRRLSDILEARGLATAGWEEIALREAPAGGGKAPNPGFLDRDFRPYVWNNVWGWGAEDLGYRLANAGYRVVLANATNLYFDLAYDKHPEEPGYIWAGFVDTRKPWELVPLDIFLNAGTDLMGRPLDPGAFARRARLTAAGRRNVLGIQGQLWGENAKGPAVLEYLAFPKLLGLAERAWAAAPDWARTPDAGERQVRLAAAWNEFANRLGQRELPRLDRLEGGIRYRLPPPGAVIESGLLAANVAFPGLPIRYTTDGGEPAADSPLYAGPVQVDGAVRLRTFDSRGRGSRTIVVGADVE